MRFLPIILCLLVACGAEPNGVTVENPDNKPSTAYRYNVGDTVDLKVGIVGVINKPGRTDSDGPYYRVRFMVDRKMDWENVWEFEIKGLVK